MPDELVKIGLGGGCHWCTEAVFKELAGVERVDQGYIASAAPYDSLSEGIVVHYRAMAITLTDILRVHLHTHRATAAHSFREKYRSACYYFNEKQAQQVKEALALLQNDFAERLITQVLPFRDFRQSRESIQDYYNKNPNAPFCQRYIEPKLKLLRKDHAHLLKNQG